MQSALGGKSRKQGDRGREGKLLSRDELVLDCAGAGLLIMNEAKFPSIMWHSSRTLGASGYVLVALTDVQSLHWEGGIQRT